MSRKDYEVIARVLKAEFNFRRDAREWLALDAVRNVASALARTFADDNPRFDYDRFIRACELDS